MMASPIVAKLQLPDTMSVVGEPTQAHANPVFRIVRIAIAIPLFISTVCSLLPVALIPVSSQAVINVRLTPVRANAAGLISKVSLETGDQVYAGQEIASLRPQGVAKQIDLSESVRNQRDLEQQSAEIAGRLTAAQERLSQTEGELQSYSDRIVAQWELEIANAGREQTASEQDAERVAEEVKRDEKAALERVIPQSMLAQAREKLLAAHHLAGQQAANVQRLNNQLGNMKAGYFVGSGVEQPRYVAVRDETKGEVTNLRHEQAALQARLGSVRGEVIRKAKQSGGSIAVQSPVTGIVWGRISTVGQPVEEGGDILRIADAGSVHVDAWIDRRYGPQLSIGDSALIYLSGLGKELIGRVTAFQGTSRLRLDEENNAIDLQPVHPDQYRVTIQLNPSDRNPIYIGQAAKVLFPGRASSLKAHVYQFLAKL